MALSVMLIEQVEDVWETDNAGTARSAVLPHPLRASEPSMYTCESSVSLWLVGHDSSRFQGVTIVLMVFFVVDSGVRC